MSRDPSAKTYFRELALAALHRYNTGLTADELAEFMVVLAQGDGHDRALWGQVNPSSVAGYLRALENDARAMKLPESRQDSRHGRAQPVWTHTGSRVPSYPMPSGFAIDAGERAPAPAALPRITGLVHEYVDGELSVPQAQALLSYGDDLMESISRFMQDLQRVNERARARLADVGIQVPRR